MIAAYAFALSSDLDFFALILDNLQKYHRCVGKGINGIIVFHEPIHLLVEYSITK